MKKNLEQQIQESNARIFELEEKLKAQEAEKQRVLQLEETLRQNNEKIAELEGQIQDNKPWRVFVKQTVQGIKEKAEEFSGKVKDFRQERKLKNATEEFNAQTDQIERTVRCINEIKADIEKLRNINEPSDKDAYVAMKYACRKDGMGDRYSDSSTMKYFSRPENREDWSIFVGLAMRGAEARLEQAYCRLAEHRRLAEKARIALSKVHQH